MCFDGAVGAARGFGIGAGCVVYISGFVFLITDNVAHCRQNRWCGYVVDISGVRNK